MSKTTNKFSAEVRSRSCRRPLAVNPSWLCVGRKRLGHTKTRAMHLTICQTLRSTTVKCSRNGLAFINCSRLVLHRVVSDLYRYRQRQCGVGRCPTALECDAASTIASGLPLLPRGEGSAGRRLGTGAQLCDFDMSNCADIRNLPHDIQHYRDTLSALRSRLACGIPSVPGCLAFSFQGEFTARRFGQSTFDLCVCGAFCLHR
jgi:hypothetical protein